MKTAVAIFQERRSHMSRRIYNRVSPFGKKNDPYSYGNPSTFGSSATCRKGRMSSKMLLSALLIFISVSVATAMTVITIMYSHEDLNEDLCPINGFPISCTTLILDLTDPWSDSQKRAFDREFSMIFRELKVGEHISVYAIAKTGQEEEAQCIQLFSKCRPKDETQADPNVESPKQVGARYRKEFEQPLKEAVAGIDTGQKAVTSPILETLLTAAMDPYFSDALDRRIFIFSDMLENSDHVNHYGKNLPAFSSFSGRSLRVLDVAGKLQEAQVTVFVIPDTRQNDNHSKWWSDYFSLASVESYTFKAL